MRPTAAAPCSKARATTPSMLAEWRMSPGSGMSWMRTALPFTSRPTKSAAVPVPTHTRSHSMPSGGVEGVRVAGPRRLERHRLAAAVNVDLPGLRRPLRRQVERQPVDVLQAELLEVPLDPRLRRVVARRADVAAPEQVAAVALILQRDRIDFHQELPEAPAVDIGVLAVLGRQERRTSASRRRARSRWRRAAAVRADWARAQGSARWGSR